MSTTRNGKGNGYRAAPSQVTDRGRRALQGPARNPATVIPQEEMPAAMPHTPGPWWIDDRRPSAGSLQIQAARRGDGSSYCVASVNFWEVPEANACLIAAAPDMLQMLVSAHALLAGSHGSQQFEDQCGYLAAQIADVLIKATGSTATSGNT